MFGRNFYLSAVVALVAMLPASLSAQQMEHGHDAAGIEAQNAWSRATAPSAQAGAMFVELVNNGGSADLLVGAKSDVAEQAQLHTHLMDNGIMRMRRVEAFEIAPGSPTVLQPGGHHIMLIGLKRQLVEGETIPVTLTFRDAGEIEVQAVVGSAAARAPAGGHGKHGDHGNRHGS